MKQWFLPEENDGKVVKMAEDIYFSKEKRQETAHKKKEASFTEKISSDQLSRKPGELSFGDIVTEREKINSHTPVHHTSEKKGSKKKKSKRRKAFLTVFILFAVIFTAAAVIGVSAVSYVLSDYEKTEFEENRYIEDKELLNSPTVYNILLMGIDTLNTEDSSRSDAMILMSLDTVRREIKLTSFLRDSYVYIPGIGNAKLNAACTYGGPQLVCDTIEYNFGVEIDDFAKVGYDMFIKIIDAVGGVTVPEIDKTEASALAREGFKVDPGTDIHLNGEQALKYCRIRKGQDDFYRTGRQREVITLVLGKLPKANPVTLIKTAKEIAGTIECSIDKNEFPALLVKALFSITGEIKQARVPADGTWENATKNYQAVLVIDFDKNNKELENFLYGRAFE